MSATLVRTMALAGGHGCPNSGWHSPGYTTYYAPHHATYYAPAQTYYAPGHHTSYYAPRYHTFHHAPAHTTYYRYQPPSCAGGRYGAPSGQTFGDASGGYGGQYAPIAPYSEGDDSRARGYDRAAPPPPDVPGARDGRDARAPMREGARDRRGERPAAVVEMTNEARFQPERVTITAGQTVEWRNTSDHVHTVTADPEMRGGDNVTLPEGAQPFHSGEVRPGETFTHTFDTPGQYRYVCLPHEERGMIGEIEVLEENGEGGRAAGRPRNRLPEPPRQPREGGARY
jgi:plastocyanin